MADISQITQELTQFGPAPDSLDPATFNQRADATVAHLHTHVNEQNTITKQTNKVTREINARAKDIDGKYDEIVEKYVDFIPKYNEVVTKHGEVVTMHGEVEADASYVGARKGEIDTIKTHIDNTKTQIDADLETAKSMINEGNGGVIDDAKTSAVSTWSSEKLENAFDKKVGVDDNTVSILNLKILKEKTEQIPPETAEILFRAHNGESFEVADLGMLYQGLKNHIGKDYIRSPLTSVLKTEDISIPNYPIGASVQATQCSISLEDGSTLFFDNYNPIGGSSRILKVSPNGDLSLLSIPLGGECRMFLIFENDTTPELFVSNMSKSLYKLDKTGSGSWEQIPNPLNLDFWVGAGISSKMLGTKQGSSNTKYKYATYDSSKKEWVESSSEYSIPSESSYNNTYTKENLKYKKFYASGISTQPLIAGADFGFLTRSQSHYNSSDGVAFYPTRAVAVGQGDNLEQIIYADSKCAIYKKKNGNSVILKNKSINYILDEEAGGHNPIGYAWVRLANGDIVCFGNVDSRGKTKKYTLNQKTLRYFGVEGF